MKPHVMLQITNSDICVIEAPLFSKFSTKRTSFQEILLRYCLEFSFCHKYSSSAPYFEKVGLFWTILDGTLISERF